MLYIPKDGGRIMKETKLKLGVHSNIVTTYNIQISGRNGKVVEYFLKIAPYPCALFKVNKYFLHS